MKISAVLHCAADTFLSVDGDERAMDGRWNWRYSCDTLQGAIQATYPDATAVERSDMRYRIKDGMRTLGLDTDSLNAFSGIPESVKRQGARYAWLKFCALLAEEQGE